MCTVDGCDKPIKNGRLGMCGMHTQRLRRHGHTDPTPGCHGTPEERFFRFIEKTEGCWVWQGSRSPDGYPAFRESMHGSMIGAHRFSYTLHNGPVPEGKIVRLTCDNQLCVNPAHLIVGTLSDSVVHSQMMGRRPAQNGNNNTARKITQADAALIRVKYQRGMTQHALAVEYGLRQSSISMIVRGKTWREL